MTAGSTTPLMVHSYETVTVSPSASEVATAATMSSAVIGDGGAMVQESTTGAVLLMVSGAETTVLPVSKPSLAVTSTVTTSKWVKWVLPRVRAVSPATTPPLTRQTTS